MANLNYEGKIVNSAVNDLKNIYGEWNSLISDIESLTVDIISSRGFDKYIGGIDKSSFSSMVVDCQEKNKNFIFQIRNMQSEILSYSNDQEEINAFLNELSNEEYDNLNQKLGEQNLKEEGAKNIFSGFFSTLGTFGFGLLEGVGEVLESSADFAVMFGGAVSGLFAAACDLITGSELSGKVLNATKAFVSKNRVESLFDKFYSDTDLGKKLKSNSYSFDSVRSVSKGIGFTGGLLGLGALSAGTACLGASASTTTSVLSGVFSSGVVGFSNGVEEAWHDGASLLNGLSYGSIVSAWDSSPLKLGNTKLINNDIGKKILNVLDSGIDSIVQPVMKIVYSDSESSYNDIFTKDGGWKGVANNVFTGGLISSELKVESVTNKHIAPGINFVDVSSSNKI